MGIKKDLNKPDITLSNMAVFTQPVNARVSQNSIFIQPAKEGVNQNLLNLLN